MKVLIEYDSVKADFILTENRDGKDVKKKFMFFQEVLVEIDSFFEIKQFGIELIKATRHGDLQRMRELITTNVPIESKDFYGKTPLIWAAASDNLDVINFLIQNGANVNAKDDLGFTPLMFAAEKGNIEIFKYLHQNGADINAKTVDYHFTPLMFAVREGHKHIVEYLIANNIPLNETEKTTSESYKTALIIAAENDYWDIAKLLISAGADLRAFDAQNRTITTFAGLSRRDDIINFIIDYTQNAYLKDYDLNQDPDIIKAVRDNNLTKVKAILEKTPQDINRVGTLGKTSIIWASSIEDGKILDFLITCGANINDSDYLGFNGLMFACEKGCYNNVEKLLNFGAEINSKTKDKLITPLIFAAKNGFENVVSLLVNRGANIHSKAKLHMFDSKPTITPLLFAAQEKKWNIVNLLIKYGSNASDRDLFSRTAIYFASQFKQWDIVDLLVLNGGDINSLDIWDGNAVLYAAKKGDLDALIALSKRNGNLKFKDIKGMTPYDYAFQNGFIEVAEWIREESNRQFWF
ncbi:ankyrin repeat domain-containing protein [bacterium]|nr:ankyrin repeat domain-containing protein [bacterium]